MVKNDISNTDFITPKDNSGDVSYEEIVELLQHRHSSQVVGEGDVD